MNEHKTKARFLLTLLAILLISGVVFWAVSVPRHMGEADAVDGVLDLSGADFDDTLYPLNGEWELYYGKLYTPEDFAGASPEDFAGTSPEDFTDGSPEDFANNSPGGMELVDLPGGWADMGYPVPAYGTFRLTLKTGAAQRLMLHIPEIAEAGVVWLNGEKVYEVGVQYPVLCNKPGRERLADLSVYPALCPACRGRDAAHVEGKTGGVYGALPDCAVPFRDGSQECQEIRTHNCRVVQSIPRSYR
ncbi:MAG: hypothetical protein LBJ91_05655 [Clostridiales Family XIII bacterium]|jgi:hypothetical protein|nr:hypothetical protein [Clostridiales Family XIII bacterium]